MIPCTNDMNKRFFILVLFALLISIGVVGTSLVSFKVCFGAVLVLIACGQVYVMAMLIINRQNPLIELCQPRGLALFVMAAIVATISCFTLALPKYDVSCALRQPIILMCISFMGSILVTRCWRISCIISPTITFASSSDNYNKDILQAARIQCMDVLSMFLQWTKLKKIQTAARPNMTRQITFADSMRVACVLMLPQIILQILNLSVPALRVRSYELYDGIYVCQSDISGPVLLIVGVIVASLPFLIALILNIETEGVPDKFREFDDITLSLKLSILILAITLPTIGMIDDMNMIPNAHTYLMASSVLSFILPLCYNIAWAKVVTLKSPVAAQNDPSQRLEQRISSSNVRTKKDDMLILQRAEDASMMVKMFEAMGQREKALEIDRDILSMFKKDGKFSWEEGFSLSEIRSFGPKELELVVSTLIRGGKIWGNIGEAHVPKSAQITLHALEIFDKAPSKVSVMDKSFMFAGFSYLALRIKAGDIKAPSSQDPREFEDDIASRYMDEACSMFYHHYRSLAWKAEIFARYSDYENALSVVDEMRKGYNPKLHYGIIAKEYGMDYCSVTISSSLLWHRYVNLRLRSKQCTEEHTKDKQACSGDNTTFEYIITKILPEIGSDQAVNYVYVFIPIIITLNDRSHGQATRVLSLYKQYVSDPILVMNGKAHFAIAPFVRPLLIALQCHSVMGTNALYDEIKDDVEWLLDGGEKVTDFLDTVYMNYGFDLNIYALLAANCLSLTKLIDICGSGEITQRRGDLIKEGLRYSDMTEKKMKDDNGNIATPVKAAYAYNSKIYHELLNLNIPA